MVDIHITAEILKLGKKLAPDRFPKPDPEITQAWATALNREYPTRLWAEAVYLWATQRVEDKMCTPRDILNAAADTVHRWESNPTDKQELETFRTQRMHTKYQQMLGAAYTPQSVPGAPPQQKELTTQGPDFQALKQRLAKARKAIQ